MTWQRGYSFRYVDKNGKTKWIGDKQAERERAIDRYMAEQQYFEEGKYREQEDEQC